MDELERVAQTIASCMQCRCCPCDQCKARENSSMANCVRHWMETMRKAVDESKHEEMPTVPINDHSDIITALKAALVFTNTDDTYSKGFRNGLRFAIACITDEEPKYEEVPAVPTNDGMGDPCITCKMSFESKLACCGCPDRRRWESKQMPKKE